MATGLESWLCFSPFILLFLAGVVYVEMKVRQSEKPRPRPPKRGFEVIYPKDKS